MSWWHDQAARYPLLTPSQEIILGQQVRVWLDHPDPVPPAIERRGRRATDRMIRANLRLVISFAERYRSVPAQYQDDLIQAGNLGLMRAVEKFDPARGYKFSTYAYWWIRQGIHSFLEQHGRSIRLPTTHSAQYTKIQTAILELSTQLNRNPSRQEIADELGWTTSLLDRVLTRPTATMSLDQENRRRDDGGPLSETIQAPGPLLLEQVESAQELDSVLSALQTLDPQAQRIMVDQFLSPCPTSLQILAKREGVNRETIRHLINRSLNQLRLVLKGVDASPVQAAPPAADPAEYGPQLVLFSLLD